MFIKNKKDISYLIKDTDIRGENLSRAIIKDFNRVKCDLKGINFSFCLLGGGDRPFSIIQCDISNSNFENAQFVGTAFVRSCAAHNCNFKGADVSKASYEHTDFTDSNFCNSVIRIGTLNGIGAIFPKSMFEDLMKGWSTKFKIVESEEK
jgi:uncharacterized protein YjbI with pentapeptide repeats